MDACNLKVFKGGVVWIDSNPNTKPQVQTFVFLLGNLFQHRTSTKEALEFTQKHLDINYVIMTSSKMFDQVEKEFKDVENIYHKYLIFCSSSEKAKECEKNYKDRIFKATFDYGGVIDALSKEDEIQQAKTKKYKIKN